MSGNDWSNTKGSGYEEPAHSTKDLDLQQGKHIKALIGLAVLVILAVIFSQMHPVSHEVSRSPAVTTGQTTESIR